jgi:hypothetical protein
MLDSLPLVTRATLVGPVAARPADADGRGTVRAVFDRSFYVALDAGWICVGPESMGGGPLNLLCTPWFAGLRAVLEPGDLALVENGSLRAGPVRISLACAQRWHPQPLGSWSRSSLARGLTAFADALPRLLPSDGLARLLRPTGTSDLHTPVLAAAQAPVGYLAQFLQNIALEAADIDADQIGPLIGLGPGLTPSGDDYLGGILIALSLIGQTCLRDQLWQILEPLLAHRTGDISRAHLAAAAGGLGNAALHDVLHAILAGRTDAISFAVASISALGHTSGWDTLAGGVAVLRTV